VPDPERVLVGGPAGYRLDVPGGQLDAVRFERLVEAARSAHAASEPEQAPSYSPRRWQYGAGRRWVSCRWRARRRRNSGGWRSCGSPRWSDIAGVSAALRPSTRD